MNLTNELVIQKEKELTSAMLASNTSELRMLIADEMIFINLVSVSVSLTGTYSGQAFSGKFKYGRTWKSLNNKLQVISAQCSVLK